MENEMNTTPAAEEKTSMGDYEAELEASLKKLEEGDLVSATVIAVD